MEKGNSTPIYAASERFPSAHCATLTGWADGSLFCAWFAGTREMAQDVVILGARKVADDTRWTEPAILAEWEGHSLGQPVFLHHPNGELWLFYDVVFGSHWRDALPYVQHSSDDGQSWGTAEMLFYQPGLMFRSRPQVIGGRIIVPVYDEVRWQSMMMISEDNEQSWQFSERITTANGNIHPCLYQTVEGNLGALLRPGGKGGFLWQTESTDKGWSWSKPVETNQKNPNSGFDVWQTGKGRLVLANNPSSTGRNPLTISLSSDGKNWTHSRVIESDEGEFSYPCLWQTPDKRMHLVYTHQRTHIQYVSFSEDWLLNA